MAVQVVSWLGGGILYFILWFCNGGRRILRVVDCGDRMNGMGVFLFLVASC